jgi:hypothetical protein
MAYTLGSVASLCIVGPNIKVLEVIEKRISEEDLRTMQKYGLENRDGKMDRAEYLILCMLRLGVVDPELVMAIVNRYDELDLSGDGIVSYDELLEKSPRSQQRGMVVAVRRTSLASKRLSRRTSSSSEAEDHPASKGKGTKGEGTKGEGQTKKDSHPKTFFIVEETSERSTSPSLGEESPEPERREGTRPALEIEAPPSASLEKGQRISALVTQLKEQRARERSLYGGAGLGLSLDAPVKPVPLSPLIMRHMPRKPRPHSHGTLPLAERGPASFSQPRLPRPHSSLSQSLPSSRYPSTPSMPPDPRRSKR